MTTRIKRICNGKEFKSRIRTALCRKIYNSEVAGISGKADAMESLIKSAVEKEMLLPKELVKPVF